MSRTAFAAIATAAFFATCSVTIDFIGVDPIMGIVLASGAWDS